MPMIIAASDPLSTWGQIAAILLSLELFVFILIAAALVIGLMFGVSWVREKAELIKKIRPQVDAFNRTSHQAIEGTLGPETAQDNKIIRTAGETPARARSVEQKIEQGSDRVAGAMIEFRARTVMVGQMAKFFFLPGLVRSEQLQQRQQAAKLENQIGPGIKSPGLRQLVEERVTGEKLIAPGTPTSTGETAPTADVGNGQTLTASQLRQDARVP